METHELQILQQPKAKPDSIADQARSEEIRSSGSAKVETSAENNTSEEQETYPEGIHFFLPCLALDFVLLLGAMDANIVATAVPSITDHFHTVADIGWYYSAYRLCSSTLQFIFGKLYLAFSTKYVFLAAMVIFGVGSVLCAAADSSKMFVVGRAVTGIGCAGCIAGAFTLLRHLCPLRRRPVTMSLFGAVENIAIIGSPILGGVLAEKLSWRWCFWINLPVLGISLIASILFLPPDTRPRQNRTWKQLFEELDLVGNIILIPALTCLFIALSFAGTHWPWNNARTIVLFVLFGVLLAVFAIDQSVKGDNATLPPRLLKDRNVIAGFVYMCCSASSNAVLEYYMPTYFQAVHEYSPSHSGYMLIPILVGSLIGVLIQGSGTSIWGYYSPFMILASIITPIAAGLITTWSEHTDLAKLIMYSGLSGFGTGLGFLGAQNSLQTTLKKNDQPLGQAIVLFGQGFGPSLFVMLAQTIFTSRLAANIGRLAPGLNLQSIESMGLSDIKGHFSAQQLSEVIAGFQESLAHTWYLAVGLACLSIAGALATEWRSVKEKQS